MTGSAQLSERRLAVPLTFPGADVFSGTVNHGAVRLTNFNQATFMLTKGSGATAVLQCRVLATDDAAGANPVPVEFRYREHLTPDDPEVMKFAGVTGFATTAGTDQQYEIHVEGQALAGTGKKYVMLETVETVDDPVEGGVTVLMSEAKQGARTTKPPFDPVTT